jgi:hypothetical protein
VVVGAVAVAGRRSRTTISIAARVTGAATWPVSAVWRAPPLRRISSSLALEGDRARAEAEQWVRAAGDEMISRLINHPATEELLTRALDDPGLDRLVRRVIDSRLADELTARLLESEELRLILDYVTRSPELRAALAHQTAGLADDLAVGMRSRTLRGDAAAERFARRLLRRGERAEG